MTRLTDLMSRFDLAVYPTVALVIFLVVFVAVAIPLLGKRSKAECELAAQLPLAADDNAHTSPADTTSKGAF